MMPLWLAWTLLGLVGLAVVIGIINSFIDDWKNALAVTCAMCAIALVIWAMATVLEHYGPKGVPQAGTTEETGR